MANNVAIRLNVEGGPELRRTLDEAGTAGQAAFQKVGAAADQAAAATDRQTAKWQRLAQAAREAEAQARAQSNINSLLGVGATSGVGARDSASIFEAEFARQDQINAARQEQAARSAQSNINTLLGVRDAQVGAARASASAFEDAYRAETEALRRAAELRTTTIRTTVSGWRDLGTAGAATLANIEAGRRLGSLGASPAAANQNEAGRRLRNDEITNLMYQGGDVAAQLGSGSPLGMIAMQQGPQVAQIFAGPGGASVKGAFAQAGEAVSGFVSRIGLVGGAIGGVTAVAVTGIAALASYRSEQKSLQEATSGIGRASGATAGQINAIALATSTAAGVSVSAARDMGGQFAATGRIGSAMYASLIGVSRDYATATRQDLPDAVKALAEAFADPVRGAEQLNAQLGFLDAGTRDTIQRLAQQGDRLGAQRALFDAMAGSIGKADERLGFFARQWEGFKRTTSNEFDAIGRFIDRGLGGGAAEERLATLQAQLAFRQRNMGAAGGLFDGLLGFDVETIKKQIAAVQAEIEKAAKEGQTKSLGQRGLEVDALVRSLNPGSEALKRMENSAEQIRRYLADGGIDKDGASRRTMDGLLTQAKQLREDMAAGGAAYADALRAARFEGGLVGATPFGRSASGINEAADGKRVQAFRNAGTDTTSDALDKQLRAIEEERKTLLDTLTRTQSQEQVQRGGAFTRASADIQQQILAATQRFPTVDPAILAGLLEKEGGFWNTGPTRVLGKGGRPATTAWGRGQITDGAAADIRKISGMEGFDKYDVDTQVMGAAAYLSLRQQRAGGDLIKALDGYGTGPGYGLDVKRRAGQLGDVSSLAQAQEQDARIRGLQQERDALRLTTEAGGRDRETTLARIDAMKAISDAAARGIPISKDYAAQLGREALERQRIQTTGRLFQFANDNVFDREQLGRTQVDATAFAQARRIGLDSGDPRSAGVIEASRLNDGLRETKSLANEAFGGMLSDLRQGTSLISTLGNLTNRLADRLISIAADKTISSLFAGTGGTSGEGPFAAVASFLFGGAKADGGLLTGPGGPRADNLLIRASAGEYVINAASVAHYGPGFFDSLNNRAMARFADGGLVGREAFTTPRNSPLRADNGNAPTVIFQPNIIPPAGYQTEVRDVPDGRGGRRPEVTFAEITARGIGSRQGQQALRAPRVGSR